MKRTKRETMRKIIEERTIEIANYMLETGSTIREASKVFKLSRSTIHKDLSERLGDLSPKLYGDIISLLLKHKATRHISGGQSTKRKYEAIKNIANQ